MVTILGRTPKKIAQISADSGVQVTCEEIRLKSIRCAEKLLKLGFSSKDVITIASSNNPNLASVVFGCLIAGIPINTLDPLFDRDEVSYTFGMCKPKLVVCEKQNLKLIEEELNGTLSTIYVFEEVEGFKCVDELFAECAEESFVIPPIENTASHLAVILCTSGTTGPCKGVCLSHGQIIQGLNLAPGTDEDSFLSLSSLYWFTGILSLFSGTLNGWTRVITTARFEPKLALEIIERYKVTSMLMATPHYIQLLPHIQPNQLESVRVLYIGGVYVSEQLRVNLKKHLKNGTVAVAYGMSEAACLTCIGYGAPLGVGPPQRQVQIKIVDDYGSPLGPQEKGEILTKQPLNFLGYYGRPDLTREVLDEDGWIHSGDIGFFDEINNLHVVDRKKDVIKVNGHPVFPSEIEDVIKRFSSLEQVSVAGIEDVEHGSPVPAALAVTTSDQITDDDVVRIVAEHLPKHKQLLGGCYFVKELPMTYSGKVKRRDVKAIAQRLFDLKHHTQTTFL